jgi:hypothetical protein
MHPLLTSSIHNALRNQCVPCLWDSYGVNLTFYFPWWVYASNWGNSSSQHIAAHGIQIDLNTVNPRSTSKQVREKSLTCGTLGNRDTTNVDTRGLHLRNHAGVKFSCLESTTELVWPRGPCSAYVRGYGKGE